MGGRERARLGKKRRRRRTTTTIPNARFKTPPNCAFGEMHLLAAVSMLFEEPPVTRRGEIADASGRRRLEFSSLFDLKRKKKKKSKKRGKREKKSIPSPPRRSARGSLLAPPHRPRATYRGHASGAEGESHCERVLWECFRREGEVEVEGKEKKWRVVRMLQSSEVLKS